MKPNRILILDRERINWKLQRMAFQIWEHNSSATQITLIGIEQAGASVARSLGERLRQISPLEVVVHSLKVNKKDPLATPITISEDLNGKNIVLVDDVANSGKTLLYALRPVLDFRPAKVMIAVLVDREHKAFPVTPDIIGHSIATTLQENIVVELDGDTVTGAYLE
jgi:pyrimidine operon attenuation protein/uracil phosphoribosyltransferase